MDVAAGFGDSGFFFYYSGAPTVAVYSGMGSGRSLLGSGTFDTYASTSFCSSSLTFTGNAISAVFTGGVFDNISFDTAMKVVPESAAAGIFGFSLLLTRPFAGPRRHVARANRRTVPERPPRANQSCASFYMPPSYLQLPPWAR